jgi:hypothetical protein
MIPAQPWPLAETLALRGDAIGASHGIAAIATTRQAQDDEDEMERGDGAALWAANLAMRRAAADSVHVSLAHDRAGASRDDLS